MHRVVHQGGLGGKESMMVVDCELGGLGFPQVGHGWMKVVPGKESVGHAREIHARVRMRMISSVLYLNWY